MHTLRHKLFLLLSLAASVPAWSGPQQLSHGLDLTMLDRNGAPFRTFHLGLYHDGLDARRPSAVMSMPSDTLNSRENGPALDAEPMTGIAHETDIEVPFSPDIAPLLVHRYDDESLSAGPIR